MIARQEGVEEVVIGLTYSISPVHTHAYYAERAAALADCAEMDRLYLKDPGGLLTPAAVRELAPHFAAAAGERPIELHSHCTIGLAPFVYVEGLRAGLPRAAHGRRSARHEGPRTRPPRRRSATSRPRGTRTGSTRRRSPRCREHFEELGREQGLAVRAAAGVRRDVLPPPACGRHGLDDAAHARGAAPAGAASTRCWRRSAASARRWAIRSSSRRSRSSSRPRRCGT